jgi:hypothetical protein
MYILERQQMMNKKVKCVVGKCEYHNYNPALSLEGQRKAIKNFSGEEQSQSKI